jgi:hypothetical protein
MNRVTIWSQRDFMAESELERQLGIDVNGKIESIPGHEDFLNSICDE